MSEENQLKSLGKLNVALNENKLLIAEIKRLKEENKSLRALEQSWENTRLALASLRNDYDSMRFRAEKAEAERDAQYKENVNRIHSEGKAILRAEKAEHELATLKALYGIW